MPGHIKMVKQKEKESDHYALMIFTISGWFPPLLSMLLGLVCILISCSGLQTWIPQKLRPWVCLKLGKNTAKIPSAITNLWGFSRGRRWPERARVTAAGQQGVLRGKEAHGQWAPPPWTVTWYFSCLGYRTGNYLHLKVKLALDTLRSLFPFLILYSYPSVLRKTELVIPKGIKYKIQGSKYINEKYAHIVHFQGRTEKCRLHNLDAGI